MKAKNSLIAQIGTVMQLAFVPRDFNAALKYWTKTVGVGPFFRMEHVGLEATKYRGAPIDLDMSVAIAYWGDIQIELVEQHNDVPTIYKSWLDQGREGLHHVCIQVESMELAREVCKASGAEVMQEIWVAGGGEAVYVDAGGGPGGLVEMICMPQSAYDAFAFMRDQARNWDGCDPVRTLGGTGA